MTDHNSSHMGNAKAMDAVTSEVFMTLLRRHRIAKGMSQTALARKLKIVPSTVSLWESGSSIPKPEMIPKLARLLGMDAMELTRVIEPETASAN